MAPITSPAESDPLFALTRISQWVSLPPASLANPLPALCAQVLSPLLLSYYPPASGIVLAWQDVELSDEEPVSQIQSTSQKAAKKPRRKAAAQEEESSSEEDSEDEEVKGKTMTLRHIDEYSSPFLWLTATLLVFRPLRNAHITGRVSSQASTHITLSYLNVLPVSIVRSQLPSDWTWCAASGGSFSMTGGRRESSAGGEKATEGYWMDSYGMPVGETLTVGILDWDARAGEKGGKGFLRIEGSLVGVGGEAGGEGEKSGEKSGEKGAEKKKDKKEKKSKKSKSALKAQKDGDAMEIE